MQILANGQEAVATGIVSALEPEDVIVSNHRSHGHLIARGTNLNSLMAEIMAKETGVNGGKAGTLHLTDPDVNVLMTSTVVGAGPPLAIAGLAVGASCMGLRPIVEIMFFPFITLASDMLVNHAGKLRYMSGGKSSFPLTVRVKAGVGFGAGSQHSSQIGNHKIGEPRRLVLRPISFPM